MRSLYGISVLCLSSACIASGLMFGGCIIHPQNPAATQPATVLDLSTTQPSFYLQQPAEETVSLDNFDRLWKASEQACRDYLFTLDREDYRSGELTTLPLVSAQWFEPWRRDVRTVHAIEESSMATIRRTIYFNFTRNGDGTYISAPRVIVERASITERRITSVTNYVSIFDTARNPADQQHGTLESDLGFILPARYWYVLGRDPTFEKVLARKVREELANP